MTTIVSGDSGGTALTTSTAINQNANTVTVQRFTSGSGTYTTPAGVVRLHIRMIAGGGGGGGTNGSSTNGAGNSGGNTTFGNWTAVGGSSATGSAPGGRGGTNGTGTLIMRMQGNPGGVYQGGGGIFGSQHGGAGPWGGAGISGYQSSGANGTVNSGSGGGGGSGASAGWNTGGGGAGEYVEFVISPANTTYSYAVGAGGTGGSFTYAGGTGGSGIIIVQEHYNY